MNVHVCQEYSVTPYKGLVSSPDYYTLKQSGNGNENIKRPVKQNVWKHFLLLKNSSFFSY